MEIIKKIIKQALTTGVTYNVTGGTEYIITPDLTAIYYLKFSLENQIRDLGFLDPLIEPEIPEVIELIPTEPFVTTGTLNVVVGKLFVTIDNNIIISSGNDTVVEYGVLHSSDTIYSTPETLTYDNVGTSVFKRTGLIPDPFLIPYTWGAKILPTQDITNYYRAFAKNSIGVGYGEVKSQFVGEFLT